MPKKKNLPRRKAPTAHKRATLPDAMKVRAMIQQLASEERESAKKAAESAYVAAIDAGAREYARFKVLAAQAKLSEMADYANCDLPEVDESGEAA